MGTRYLLVGSFDREYDMPLLFDTLVEAQTAMKESLIETMGGSDESIFNEHKFNDDYCWSENGNTAWFSSSKGNSDWQIYEFDEILRWSAIHKIKPQDVDDIMYSAFEGGINHWCSKVKFVGEPLGKYAHEQISRNGSLMIRDDENNKLYKLTFSLFKQGLYLFLCNNPKIIDNENKCIDPCDIDADYADAIIQYALFGEVVYS